MMRYVYGHIDLLRTANPFRAARQIDTLLQHLTIYYKYRRPISSEISIIYSFAGSLRTTEHRGEALVLMCGNSKGVIV